MDAPLQLYRLPQVCELIGLRRSALYAAISRGEFPKPIKVGRRASAWRRSDIEAWLESRAAKRAKPEGEGAT
jgi:prophage regulatory protein